MLRITLGSFMAASMWVTGNVHRLVYNRC
jgi:hypothetical protein